MEGELLNEPPPEEPVFDLAWHRARIDRLMRQQARINEELMHQPPPWVYALGGMTAGTMLMMAGALFGKFVL